MRAISRNARAPDWCSGIVPGLATRRLTMVGIAEHGRKDFIMGNRAVIIDRKHMRNGEIDPAQIGVYLHWNGGRDSVEAFLEYCDIHGFRNPDEDPYGWARLCQVIANYMGGDGLSVGIGQAGDLDCDNWDNGVYIIEGWQIVGRKFMRGGEQRNYDRFDMLIHIDDRQPQEMQIVTQICEKYGRSVATTDEQA